jgi:hypothetical protein
MRFLYAKFVRFGFRCLDFCLLVTVICVDRRRPLISHQSGLLVRNEGSLSLSRLVRTVAMVATVKEGLAANKDAPEADHDSADGNNNAAK